MSQYMPRLAAIRLSSLALARQPSFASTSRCKRSPPAAALLSRLSRLPYAPPSLWPQGWRLQRGRSYDLPAATANYHGPRRYPVATQSLQCVVRTQQVSQRAPDRLSPASHSAPSTHCDPPHVDAGLSLSRLHLPRPPTCSRSPPTSLVAGRTARCSRERSRRAVPCFGTAPQSDRFHFTWPLGSAYRSPCTCTG
jgi:hypothetical protein